MRRATPLGPISPKLLKHFAAATVVLTGLLALFASGEDWGAQTQFEAVEAKNQLVATEAEKLGTKRLTAKLKVAPQLGGSGFGDDGGGDFSGAQGSGGSGGGSNKPASPTATRQRLDPDVLPPNLLTTSGSSVTLSGVPRQGSPRSSPKRRAPAAAQAAEPTPEQLEAIQASSRERSTRASGSGG